MLVEPIHPALYGRKRFQVSSYREKIPVRGRYVEIGDHGIPFPDPTVIIQEPEFAALHVILAIYLVCKRK
jgi:hypothetical protein